ncbi:MAG: sulfurtransferase TusA family protein [Alistipes senegalensis]|nr:sulfurtransferase TusA family protein [Alistipes senegalensis]
MDDVQVSREVDTRGEKCPRPILMAKKALSTMESGQVLRVLATDPAAIGDFRFFTSQTGHILLNQHESDGEYTLYLKRK